MFSTMNFTVACSSARPGNPFGFHSLFSFSRYFSQFVDNDPQSFIDSVRRQCELGFSRPDIPISLFHQLVSFRPRPSIVIFNQLFTAMSKIRPHPPFSAIVTLYNQLELSDLCPDRHSVGILGNCYCALGRVDFAFSVMGKGLKLGYPPNIVTYSSLIRGLCNLGQWDGAKDLLTQMLNNNVSPNVVTYNTLLDGYCLVGKMVEAEMLLNIMVKYGMVPSVVTFNCLIKGYCKSENVDKALDIFRDMHLRGTKIIPNVVTYNTLIDTLCRNNKLEPAMQLFNGMKDPGVMPDVFTYSSLLRGLFRSAQIEKAISLHSEMEDKGIAPTLVTYGIILDGLCEAGQLAEAQEMFTLLVAKGLQPNVHIYTIMIKGLCKQGLLSDAIETLKEMRDKGCSPNERTYNTIIKGFLNANDVDIASSFTGLLTSCNVSDSDKALLQKLFSVYDGEEKPMDGANSGRKIEK